MKPDIPDYLFQPKTQPREGQRVEGVVIDEIHISSLLDRGLETLRLSVEAGTITMNQLREALEGLKSEL